MISKYIEKSTGLTANEIENVSLFDWVCESSNRKSNPYRIKHPRLIRPHGSIFAIFQRFIKIVKVNSMGYLNNI